jgi:hypothetical protein
MGCYDAVLSAQKRIVRRRRFTRQYVNRGTRQTSVVQRISQILLYDQPTAGRIDEKGAWFHKSKGFCIYNSLGLRKQRAVQTDDIGSCHKLIEFTPLKVGPVGNLASDRFGRYYPEFERERDLGDTLSNLAKTDYFQRLARQLDPGRVPEAKVRGTRPFSRASRIAVKPDLMAQLEKQRKSELSYRCCAVGRDIGDHNILITVLRMILFSYIGKPLGRFARATARCTSSKQLRQRAAVNKRGMSHRLGFRRPLVDAVVAVTQWFDV